MTTTSSSSSSSRDHATPLCIACGVTGAGKSTILDILCDDAGRFVTGSSASSVTRSLTEYIVTVPTPLSASTTTTRPPPPVRIKLVDAPGQFDSDQSLEEKNHQLLQALVRSTRLQCWLFVVTPIGGRITSSDVAAYRRIVSCFGVKPESILGIVNRDPSLPSLPSSSSLSSSSTTSRDEPPSAYHSEVLEVLEENKMSASAWLFVPELDLTRSRTLVMNPSSSSSSSSSESQRPFLYRYQYKSRDVVRIKAQVLHQVERLHAQQHRVIRERETAERLAKEQAEVKAEQERARAAQVTAEEERARALAAQVEVARQQAIAQARERDAAAARAAAALAAQQAEQARLQALADAQVYPIKCEAPSCLRHCERYTVGHVRIHGRPQYNCKNDGHRHHCWRVKGE